MGAIKNLQKSLQNLLGIKSYSGGYPRRTIASLLKEDAVIDTNTYFGLYEMNGDIRQAIKKIANSVARNGLYLQDNNRQTIENNVVTDEVQSLFLDRTFQKFKIELFRQYLITGELYIIPELNPFGEVVGFQILDTRQVEKVLDNVGNITQFKVTSYNGQTYWYGLEDLAYFKLENSLRSSVDGMGLLNGIVYDGLCDLEAVRTNYSFYKNSAIPSAMLLLNDDLAPSEIQNAKESFEAQFRGSMNAHKTMVAGGVKDLKTLSLTNRDMEFINQRHLTTEKVCAVFGVPKMVLGYVENVNYNNAREQRKEFLEGTVKPYEDDFEDIMNTLLLMFRPDIYTKYWIKCDGEQLEETEELHNSQRQDVLSGILTPNEVRIDRGLEPIQDENADKLITTRNAVLLEDIGLDAVLSPNEE